MTHSPHDMQHGQKMANILNQHNIINVKSIFIETVFIHILNAIICSLFTCFQLCLSLM